MAAITATGISMCRSSMRGELTICSYVPTSVATTKYHLLDARGSIKGRIVDASGGKSYVTVLLLLEGDFRLIKRTRTDVDGYYTFTGLYLGLPLLKYSVIEFASTYNARVFSNIQAVAP